MNEDFRRGVRAVLCVLEELRFRDLDGPFVAFNPDGHPLALPWDDGAVKRLCDRVGKEAESHFGKAEFWENDRIEQLEIENRKLRSKFNFRGNAE